MSYIAGIEPGRDTQIWWSKPGAFGFGAPSIIDGRRSFATPALGRAGEDLYMAWMGSWYKGPGFGPVTLDTTMRWSGFDNESEQWLPEHPLPLPEFRTRYPPALSGLAGTLYMAWTEELGEVIFWSKLSLDRQTWLPARAIGMPDGIDSGPALACAGTLHIAYQWGDAGICWTSFNPVRETWSMPATLLGDRGTTHAPALVGAGGELLMAWKGQADNQQIYWSSGDGTTWSDPQAVPDAYTTAAPALGTIGGQAVLAWTWGGGAQWTSYYGGGWSAPAPIFGARADTALAIPN